MTSKTRSGPGAHFESVGEMARQVAGLLRRMAITLTSRAIWQVTGHRLLDGTIETRDAEAFTGIGYYARPPSSGNPEAIVGFVGGAGNPVVLASRDEKTRQAVAGSLAADESAMFNSQAIVMIRADGTIEIRKSGGSAGPLVPLSEFLNHSHASFGAPPSEITPSVPPGFEGTKALKAE